MRLKIFILVSALIVALAFFAFSQTNRGALTLAEDFPRGAFVYAQINDLPALIKIWNESKFKENYTASENFSDFKNNHLGRKLASRWTEFNEASGFLFDLETVAGLSENRAAIALYDIGKLEFVFVAPVSDEIFAATKFVQNRNKFEEETLEDGTIVYRVAVEADRGRQKQELIFAQSRGRLVLATSEKLLAQTLRNIEGNQAKSRLSDEASFAALSEKIEPHEAFVWVNQAALNDDYYFRRYWLMSDRENLKNFRAGIFDFEIAEGKLVERRKFLLGETERALPFENARADEMLSFLPEDVPFFSLQTANPKTIDAAIKTTIFERDASEEKQETIKFFQHSLFDNYSGYFGNNYFSEKFDEAINDADEDETVEKRAADVDFSKFLRATNTKTVLTFAAPEVLPAPMFVRFNRAAIFGLNSSADFSDAAFEAAIARKLSEQTMISAPRLQLNWESKIENNLPRRELRLPMLGIEVCYMMRGRELILANDARFLQNFLLHQNPAKTADISAPLTGLTVVNFNRWESAFDSVFAELSKNKVADDFFTGNIASLLDSIKEVKKIEIKENRSSHFLDEEIVLYFK